MLSKQRVVSEGKTWLGKKLPEHPCSGSQLPMKTPLFLSDDFHEWVHATKLSHTLKE